MIVDIFLLYSFIKRLATPFKEWKAFDMGIIDEKGAILKTRSDLNPNEKAVFGLFDLLILNLKKLLAKIPGGGGRIVSFAAALMLLRESAVPMTDQRLDELLETLEPRLAVLVEEVEGSTGGAPTNNTTNIAKNDGPALMKVKRVAHKKRIKDTSLPS